MKINKSLLANGVSISLIGIGYLMPLDSWLTLPVRTVGLYATSGAVTNWLAVYMLFEKIPGLYGSGVIPSRFEEFKAGIRSMMMGQFFTKDHVEGFLNDQTTTSLIDLNPEPLLELIDFDALFQRLVEAVLASPMGGMLGMFGGPKVLAPLREPFEANLRSEVHNLSQSPELGQALRRGLSLHDHASDMVDRIDRIVQKRLDELTPAMVKGLVQDMIREHLGWLVVWGGVFGGGIGLLASFFR